MLDRETIKYLISTLRSATVSWSGRTLAMNTGRRKRLVGKYKDGRNKYLWEVDCKSCNEWFLMKDNKIQIDHVCEIGSFKGDWNDYINRMFCAQSNLQRLCIECHLKKTGLNSTLRFQRKEINNAEDFL